MSLWPMGTLEYTKPNISVSAIQSGSPVEALTFVFVISWDQWNYPCYINQVKFTVPTESLNSYGVATKYNDMFTNKSITCNRTHLELRIQAVRDFESYFDDQFAISFNERATIRGVIPEPQNIVFRIPAQQMPEDVNAAVAANNVGNTASLGGAMAGGATATSAQALAIVGLMKCARATLKEATKGAKDSMVPLAIDDTYQGWLISNAVLVALISVIHFPAVVIVKELKRCSWTDARELAKFPSLSFMAILILHQGIAYSSFRLLKEGTTKADLWMGVLGTLYSWGMPIGMWVWAQRWVKTKWVPFTIFDGVAAWKKFPLPQGFFLPEQFGGAIGELREKTKALMIMPYIQMNGVCLIGAIDASTPQGCEIQYSTCAAWFFLFAIYVLAVRPFRGGYHNATQAIMYLALGSVALGAAISQQNKDLGEKMITYSLLAQSSLATGISALSILLTAIEIFILRPRQFTVNATKTVLGMLASKDGKSTLGEPILDPDGGDEKKSGRSVSFRQPPTSADPLAETHASIAAADLLLQNFSLAAIPNVEEEDTPLPPLPLRGDEGPTNLTDITVATVDAEGNPTRRRLTKEEQLLLTLDVPTPMFAPWDIDEGELREVQRIAAQIPIQRPSLPSNVRGDPLQARQELFAFTFDDPSKPRDPPASEKKNIDLEYSDMQLGNARTGISLRQGSVAFPAGPQPNLHAAMRQVLGKDKEDVEDYKRLFGEDVRTMLAASAAGGQKIDLLAASPQSLSHTHAPTRSPTLKSNCVQASSPVLSVPSSSHLTGRDRFEALYRREEVKRIGELEDKQRMADRLFDELLGPPPSQSVQRPDSATESHRPLTPKNSDSKVKKKKKEEEKAGMKDKIMAFLHGNPTESFVFKKPKRRHKPTEEEASEEKKNKADKTEDGPKGIVRALSFWKRKKAPTVKQDPPSANPGPSEPQPEQPNDATVSIGASPRNPIGEGDGSPTRIDVDELL